ncbi:hypothetical protein V8C44DRAFT_123919 [Trichoderma aethiopicum]
MDSKVTDRGGSTSPATLFFLRFRMGLGTFWLAVPRGRTDISSKLCLVHPQSVCFIFFSLDESISAYVTASIPGSCLFIISLPYLTLYEYIYLSSISFLRKQSQRLFGFTFRFRPFAAVLPCQEQHTHHAGAHQLSSCEHHHQQLDISIISGAELCWLPFPFRSTILPSC